MGVRTSHISAKLSRESRSARCSVSQVAESAIKLYTSRCLQLSNIHFGSIFAAWGIGFLSVYILCAFVTFISGASFDRMPGLCRKAAVGDETLPVLAPLVDVAFPLPSTETVPPYQRPCRKPFPFVTQSAQGRVPGRPSQRAEPSQTQDGDAVAPKRRAGQAPEGGNSLVAALAVAVVRLSIRPLP